jgi:hypothetical protein
MLGDCDRIVSHGLFIAGMAKENPRHHALSLAEFIAAFSRVLSAVP